MKTGFIYVLSDSQTGEIRYVGKTAHSLESRFRKHLENARLNVRYHVYNWIRSLPVSPLIEVVEECPIDKLNEVECFYISYFRSLGFRLTNHTDGGDGTFGYKLTPERRRSISESQRGRRCSEETRKRMSVAQRGRRHTEESKLKMSQKRKGAVLSEEKRIVLSKAHGGRDFIDKTTGTVYRSQAQAARALGVCQGQVRDVLIGRRKHVHGHRFEYV